MLKYFFYIIITIAFLLLFISTYFAFKVLYPKTIDHERGFFREINNGSIDIDFYNLINKEEICINSPYGYRLYGLFFNNNSTKTIIICHGISLNYFSSLKYLPIYYEQGFNILVYDHRNHGKSGGGFTTYGHYEKNDLRAWVKWVKDYYGEGIIGIHGESMGASIAIQYAALEDHISFLVVDCPFSDLNTLFSIKLYEDYRIHSFPLLNMCSLINKIISGYTFKEISPIKDISKIFTPVLFIHGKEDTYVPTKMSLDLFKEKPGKKQIYLAPHSGHVESYINNRSQYTKTIYSFLKDINIID